MAALRIAFQSQVLGKTQDFVDNIEPLLQYEAENKHQKEWLECTCLAG